MVSNNIIKLDLNEKLQITIDNKKPVVLNDLTMALLGISQQYERFIENETAEENHAGSELFIKEVRSGSIVVELITETMPILPLLWQGGSFSEWVGHAKSVLEWLNGKFEQPPKELTKQDLKQWNNIVEPIAKDHGSQLNFSVSSGGVVINHFHINSAEANVAQNAIRREIELLNEPNDKPERKRVMTWYQTKFDDSSQTGSKAVIESISKSPVKVIFENNSVKKALMAGGPRFRKPWNELAYIVDVRVQTVQGVPKVYTVINYYDDETFDPSE